MNNRIQLIGAMILAVSLVFGCAGAPKKVYFSQPEAQVAANEAFKAQIEPIKLENPYYVGFELTIKNKTAGVIYIDWERTCYVYNGKDQGRFAYKGIKADDVKSGLPTEGIASGQIFSKRIYPLKTIGFMRKRDVPTSGQRNFFPGILPNGANCVEIVITQAARQWKEKLFVRFTSKEIP